VKIYFIYKFI